MTRTELLSSSQQSDRLSSSTGRKGGITSLVLRLGRGSLRRISKVPYIENTGVLIRGAMAEVADRVVPRRACVLGARTVTACRAEIRVVGSLGSPSGWKECYLPLVEARIWPEKRGEKRERGGEELMVIGQERVSLVCINDKKNNRQELAPGRWLLATLSSESITKARELLRKAYIVEGRRDDESSLSFLLRKVRGIRRIERKRNLFFLPVSIPGSISDIQEEFFPSRKFK